MRIAIEAQRIFRKNKHGMDFVALELIRALQKIDNDNQYFIFVAPGEDEVLQESHNLKIIRVSMPSYPLWEQIALPMAVKKVKPDILHCTSNTAPIFCDVPLVVTIHDVIYLEKRSSSNRSLYQNLGWYYRKYNVPSVASKSKKILTVSSYERDRIISTLKLPANMVEYIYNSYSEHFYYRQDSRVVIEKYLPDSRYIFFLGNTDPKKNTEMVLLAYSDYLEKSLDPLPLLIADLGAKYIDEILRKMDIVHISNMLRTPGYIPNRDLPYIYSGASLFLYPSLRESFGIPMLEAMACRVPVITSNTSAMPEISGDAALLVNPFDFNDISKAMVDLLSDDTTRREHIERGMLRIKHFSWLKSAEQLLNIYKEVIY